MNVASEDQLVEALRNRDAKALEYVYKTYWSMIAHFVQLNGGQRAEAEDLFQESIIILYENIIKNDFRLHSSLKTYLYAICRNQWMKQLRDKKRLIVDLYEYVEDTPALAEENTSELPGDETIHDAIKKLGEPCYTLITRFYYDQMSLEQLAQLLNYSSPEVAKQRRFRCMERLKKLFKQRTT